MGAGCSSPEEEMQRGTERMTALAFNEYGDPDEAMKVMQVPKPKYPEAGFCVVKVRSASVNPVDKVRIKGEMKALRADAFPAVVGYDVAGIIDQATDLPKGWKIGDEVVARQQSGPLPGTIAEYCTVKVDHMAKKPESVSWDDAAAIPLAGQTALQALRMAGCGPGTEVFISGGAGGVGHLAIQIAKLLGATKVATTASPGEKTEFCEALGADVVINYKERKFEEVLRDYDVAFDTTNESDKCCKILKKGKKCVTIAGSPTRAALQAVGMEPNFVVRTFLHQKRNKAAIAAAAENEVEWRYMFLNPNSKDMTELMVWAGAGKLKVTLACALPMQQAVEVAQKNFGGRAKGKCVVQVWDGQEKPADEPTPAAADPAPEAAEDATSVEDE